MIESINFVKVTKINLGKLILKFRYNSEQKCEDMR